MRSKMYFLGVFAVLVISFVAVGANARHCTISNGGSYCKDDYNPFEYQSVWGNSKILNYTPFSGYYTVSAQVVSYRPSWGNDYICDTCKILNYTEYKYEPAPERPVLEVKTLFSGSTVVTGNNKVLCEGTTIGMSMQEIIEKSAKGSIC